MMRFRTMLAAAGRGLSQAAEVVTWNPDDKDNKVILSNGNLTATSSGSNDCVRATISKTSGKWYWEFTYEAEASLDPKVGVALASHNLDVDLGQSTSSWAVVGDGRKYHNTSITSYMSNPAVGDVVNVALDLDAGKIWMAHNGAWGGGGDPAAGTGAAYTNLPVGGAAVYPAICLSVNSHGTANFGATAFAYPPPSGFSALQS